MPTAPTIVDQPVANDDFTQQYADLLEGRYDCVDRIILRAYNSLCSSPGGFRYWWRALTGSDESLDDAHLVSLAGRFARRVRAWAKQNGVEVIDCGRGERKHEIAEEYLATHPVRAGVFLILVARASAPVWEVTRSKSAVLVNLGRKQSFVNHYSFHIWDSEVGHFTIKMSGHPPFGAQVMLNGHEYVGVQAARSGIAFTKEGNCFTATADPAALARLAGTLADEAAAGRLREVCERWIYTACLLFGLDLAEQERTRFRYDYSVYQLEYSRNLLFRTGAQMESVFEAFVDRNRSHLDLREMRAIFGKGRHSIDRTDGDARARAALGGRSRYGLSIFKLHFGKLTFKAYTKGRSVLRFEAIAHNTAELGCRRAIAHFAEVVTRLRAILERALSVLHGMDRAFVSDDTLERLPLPSQVGRTRVGGVDIGKPRMRAVLGAVLALAAAPAGFTAGELAAKVTQLGGPAVSGYDSRRASYDLKKLRGKELVAKREHSHRYQLSAKGVPTITALVVIREKLLRPLLAATAHPHSPIKLMHRPNLAFWDRADVRYQQLRRAMRALLRDLRLLPHPQTFVDVLPASA
jgi:hypothetical protein